VTLLAGGSLLTEPVLVLRKVAAESCEVGVADGHAGVALVRSWLEDESRERRRNALLVYEVIGP